MRNQRVCGAVCVRQHSHSDALFRPKQRRDTQRNSHIATAIALSLHHTQQIAFVIEHELVLQNRLCELLQTSLRDAVDSLGIRHELLVARVGDS